MTLLRLTAMLSFGILSFLFGGRKNSLSQIRLHLLRLFLISIHPSWLPPQISASCLFLVSGNKKLSRTLENPHYFILFLSAEEKGLQVGAAVVGVFF